METKTPKLEVTEENLKKAYEIIGEEFPGLEKSQESDLSKSVESEKVKEEESKEEVIEKSMSKSSEEESEEKDPPKEQKLDGKEEESKTEEKDDDNDDDDEIEKGCDKKMKKSQETEKLSSEEKVENEEESKIFKSLVSSVGQKIEAFAVINQHLTNRIEKSIESLKRLDELEKGVDTLNRKVEQQGQEIEINIEKSLSAAKEKDNTLLKSIDGLEERIEQIEKTPNTRKSIENLQYIEKSQGSEQVKGEEDGTILSISKNRKEISNILLEKSMVGTGQRVNKQYESAVLDFETSGKLSKSIMNDLSKNDNIRFTS